MRSDGRHRRGILLNAHPQFYLYGPVPGVEVAGAIIPAGLKVLLVDDDKKILESVSGYLGEKGIATEVAESGEQAIEMFREGFFDVAIIDLTMPNGLGGVATLMELRRKDPEIKAIISSGYPNAPEMVEFTRYGFLDCFVKPYRMDELPARIASIAGTGFSSAD